MVFFYIAEIAILVINNRTRVKGNKESFEIVKTKNEHRRRPMKKVIIILRFAGVSLENIIKEYFD